ncbi:HIT zinc finger containing protein [Novymonas esmeraldas]|uniref:HIT zinc finger containing protein n=1 Tax=Novymonas esmeraldas TaxID=1808958 RepID=A0AAW0F558_9TRYP
MRCIVCSAEKANYRCRTCRSAYCSSQCYKHHRVTRAEAEAATAAEAGSDTAPAAASVVAASSLAHLCEVVVAAQRPQKEMEEKRQRIEAEADVFSDVSRAKATTASPSSSATAATTTTTTATDDPASTAADASSSNAPSATTEVRRQSSVLQEEYAGDADAVYILQEKHLGALANHPRVRRALRSPALQKLIKTIDGSRSRLDALDAAQYNNADFKDFCDDVMRVIAEVEGR